MDAGTPEALQQKLQDWQEMEAAEAREEIAKLTVALLVQRDHMD